MRTLLVIVVALIAAPALAWKQPNDPTALNLHPADGRVVYADGSPLPQALVTFTGESGLRASGVTDEDGYFQLSTFALGDGAPAGAFDVSVNPDARRSLLPGVDVSFEPADSRVDAAVISDADAHQISGAATNFFELTVDLPSQKRSV